jgi:TolB-like protein/DNA-binding winged helix-turn-helix (wHTH) protein
MSAVPGQVLQIGEWSVDPALGEIASGDRLTKLDPLTMRLLLYLADNAGRVIALQELLNAVWPNVVVTPQSVYNTVAQLRRTLGDLADAPTYIANIPRKGYRLIAKVEHRQVERRAAPAAVPLATVTPPSAAAREPGAAPAPPAASPGLVDVDSPPSRVGPSRVFLIAILAVAPIGLLALVLARPGVFGWRSAPAEAVVDHSIAVLPFRDLSATQDRAYLAEGLAEQIGTVLSGVPKLRVVGRASAFASRSDSIPDIAKKLHVDHILEGSVQSSPQGVRITAALLRTDTGQYLWSKTYDRSTDDYFSVEDEIARDIAGALTNTGLPPNRTASLCGKSGAANNLLLQGRYLGRRNTTADRERSIELYQQALALEPDCAQAWAWLSTAYGVQAANGWVAPELGYQRARDAAEHALRLDPLAADAHAALAYVEEFHDWNWSGADAELKRALELDSGDVRVLNMNGHFALDLGESDRAINFYRRAVDQDPLSTGALGGLAAALWSRGQLLEAEAAYRQAAALAPLKYHAWIALVLLERGEKPAALAEIGKETDPETRLMGLGIIQSALGNREASDSAVAELIAKYAERPFHIAAVYAHRGETDTAFRWLEDAFTRRNDEMLWLKVGLLLRPLRADPRYDALLRRMGLPVNLPDAVSSARAVTSIAPTTNR